MNDKVEIKGHPNTLFIEPLAIKKIQYWADAADGEVSGLGIIEKRDDIVVVTEAFILDQECTGADTELDPEAISKLMIDIINADKDPACLKFWWHSHVNMSVFWSGTDNECAETLSNEYAFSLVVNKQRDRKVRFDLYQPFRMTADNLKLVELVEEDEILKEECKKDVKDKVKSKNWQNNRRGYYCGSYGNDSIHDLDKFKKPKNWGKRIILPDTEIADIERLSNITLNLDFSREAMNKYLVEQMKQILKDDYDGRNKCTTPGDYEENHELCKKCELAKNCIAVKRYSEVKDITNTENTLNKDKDIEINVDADNRDGDNNGKE